MLKKCLSEEKIKSGRLLTFVLVAGFGKLFGMNIWSWGNRRGSKLVNKKIIKMIS